MVERYLFVKYSETKDRPKVWGVEAGTELTEWRLKYVQVAISKIQLVRIFYRY